MHGYKRAGLVAIIVAFSATFAGAQTSPEVIEASYGHNCQGGGVKLGNVTSVVAGICKQQKGSSCTIKVDYKQFGSPAAKCPARDFRVQYRCGKRSDTQSIGGEANGQSITISCPIK
jgi:hypothetical protein